MKTTIDNEEKDSRDYWRFDYCYAGTLVTQGTGTILVDKIGAKTEYGKIGQDVVSATDNPTPLQKQTGKLVKLCAGIAAVLFMFAVVITYFNIQDHMFKDRIIESILSGVTLAMAMIPEEFPVILTVFLSMGAWRVAKKKSLVRKLPSVETLGAVSVLCVDKTGTITMNKMTVDSIEDIPEKLTDCHLELCGMVGLADPPRESVKEDIKTCTKAGVRVVMITGDNGITASSIAKQINMPNSDKIITGDELSKMSDEELREKVKDLSIFSRVIPEHKMRIVKAFKENGEIVAMTGDGVNDAPALKYADIGIAMGKRGSEVSREAADLILLDYNFSTIVDTIKDGRRIYDNIRKAVGYVFVIHIPIAFAALFAPLMGISPGALLLLPLHVVLQILPAQLY